MGELSKIGRALWVRLAWSLVGVMAVPFVFVFLFGSAFCAGLIDTDLIAPVLLCEFISLFPLGMVLAVGVGLGIRGRVVRMLDPALAPSMGAQRAFFGALRWQSELGGRRVSARYYGHGLHVQLPCDSTLELHFGLDNALARSLTKGRTVRELGGGRIVVPKDAEALDRFLARPGVEEALAALLHQDGRSLRSLWINKGVLHWMAKYIPRQGWTEDTGRAWFEGLSRLAEAAEAEPSV